MKTFRIGVIGVGKMGEYHVGVLSEQAEAELVLVADNSEKRAEEISKRYNVPFVTKAEDAIGKVDAVVIAVPTALHYVTAKMFLDAGVHVLLEKPCAHDLSQAKELFRLAEEKNLTLHIGHVERFNGAVQELHKIVDEPLFVECKRTGPFPQRNIEDGVVMDVMIHDIDIVLNLVKSRVTRIQVMGLSVFSDRDDLVSVQLQFESGTVANILASRASQNKERTLCVTLKDSYVMLDYTDQEIYVHRQSSSEHQLNKGSLRYKQESLVERIFVHKDNPLKHEVLHFIDCASNGSPRHSSVDRELYSLEIALRIVEQFKEQRQLA